MHRAEILAGRLSKQYLVNEKKMQKIVARYILHDVRVLSRKAEHSQYRT